MDNTLNICLEQQQGMGNSETVKKQGKVKKVLKAPGGSGILKRGRKRDRRHGPDFHPLKA